MRRIVKCQNCGEIVSIIFALQRKDLPDGTWEEDGRVYANGNCPLCGQYNSFKIPFTDKERVKKKFVGGIENGEEYLRL